MYVSQGRGRLALSGSRERVVSWFRHRCNFCKHKSREVVFIVGDGVWQCADREECIRRNDSWLDEQRLRMSVMT